MNTTDVAHLYDTGWGGGSWAIAAVLVVASLALCAVALQATQSALVGAPSYSSSGSPKYYGVAADSNREIWLGGTALAAGASGIALYTITIGHMTRHASSGWLSFASLVLPLVAAGAIYYVAFAGNPHVGTAIPEIVIGGALFASAFFCGLYDVWNRAAAAVPMSFHDYVGLIFGLSLIAAAITGAKLGAQKALIVGLTGPLWTTILLGLLRLAIHALKSKLGAI